jgi:hypothetical protein
MTWRARNGLRTALHASKLSYSSNLCYFELLVHSPVMMNCHDCGAGLDDVPVGDPCPKCGSRRRDATVFAHPATAKVVVPTPTIGIGYNPHRPWQQKWQDVEYGLEQVESAYDAPQGWYDNEHMRRVVEGFFKDCRELADWLWQDHLSTGLDKKTVMNDMMADPDLRLADAIAQTTKHHTRKPSRTNPDPITARITDIITGPGGRQVKIGWS